MTANCSSPRIIDVQKYTSDLEQEWDEFVETDARNATFLHTRKFLKHNPLNIEEDESLIFRKKNKIIAVLPAIISEYREKKVFYSHMRSTYGGFVVSKDFGVKEAVETVALTIDFVRTKCVEEIIIRNPFRIFYTTPTDETDYAMWYHGFKIKFREIECAIPLTSCKYDEVLNSFNSKTRNQVRQGQKFGLSIRQSNDYENFWNILNQNLRLKYDAKPTHSVEEILRLRDNVGKEKVVLFGAYKDDKMIAGAVFFFVNRKSVHTQYMATDKDYLSFRPMNAIIYEAAKWAVENSYEWLNLGMAMENSGSEINYGLYDFKEGFGGRGVLRETMSLAIKSD